MDLLRSLLWMAPAVALGLWAQWRVVTTLLRWGEVPTSVGISGASAARRILRKVGLDSVAVRRLDDCFSDHYDPHSREVCLSSEVFDRCSVTALAVAAHECGHALQHASGYRPLRWRETTVPLTRISGGLLPWLLMVGMGFRLNGLVLVGVVCHGLMAFVQLITLPVEFDASRRAQVLLAELRLIQPGREAAGVRSVLQAAALTYVAAVVQELVLLLGLWRRQRRPT